MPPTVAAAVVAIAIAGLFRLERDRTARTSPALWIPVIWLFLGSSRMVSQWLAGELPVGPLDLYYEGSPFDRLFLSALIVSAVAVLMTRARQCGPLLRENGPLVVFFLYCLLSVLWSDYPFVAFKRLTKFLGNVTMLMVVLTDPNPRAAVKRFFSRAGFLLIPISILFIKYFPTWGRLYNRWTWQMSSIGVSTDKNGLGTLCLVFGLASMWRLIDAFQDRTDPDRTRRLIAHGSIVLMAFWLVIAANSTTSLGCLLLGTVILLLTKRPEGARAARVNVIVTTLAVTALAGFAFQGMYTYVVQGLGRNTTLTGRTELWSDLFGMTQNPWFGTGFESFWLGPRAAYLWEKYYFRPNQAHNGYIETYINLGWMGVALLVFLVTSGYRNIVSMYQRDKREGSLRLAFLIVALVYNITEAAFKVMHPLWITFVLAVAAVPVRARMEDREQANCGFEVLPVSGLGVAEPRRI